MITENAFRDLKIRPLLESYPPDMVYYFIKEAASIRAIPDIIVCVNGFFLTIEIKRSRYEAMKKKGRVVQQKYEATKIKRAKGHAWICYPENYEDFNKWFIEFVEFTSSRYVVMSQSAP
jgi:Holliday junction resolvase